MIIIALLMLNYLLRNCTKAGFRHSAPEIRQSERVVANKAAAIIPLLTIGTKTKSASTPEVTQTYKKHTEAQPQATVHFRSKNCGDLVLTPHPGRRRDGRPFRTVSESLVSSISGWKTGYLAKGFLQKLHEPLGVHSSCCCHTWWLGGLQKGSRGGSSWPCLVWSYHSMFILLTWNYFWPN